MQHLLDPLSEAIHQARNLPPVFIDEAEDFDQIDPCRGPVGIVPQLVEGGGEPGLCEGALNAGTKAASDLPPLNALS